MSQEDQKRREQDQRAQVLQQQYNQYQETLTDLQLQLSTLGSQNEEHKDDSKNLSKIPKEERTGRKCFKMIGGVVVEKTISEIITVLDSDVQTMNKQKTSLEAETSKVKKEMESWMAAKNVKIMRQWRN